METCVLLLLFIAITIQSFMIIQCLARNKTKAEENARRYPEYRSGAYQGDIDLAQMMDWRNGISKMSMKWPNGVVYYEFDKAYPFSDRTTVTNAIDNLARKVNEKGACISFEEGKGNGNFVSIVNDASCTSAVGMMGGKQVLTLGTWYCLEEEATIQHETLHALGFWHEQARSDRDSYVKILFENVANGQSINFHKETKNMDLLDTSYNYASLLHYDEYAFSKNAEPTMVALQPGVILGGRDLSDLDIKRVRILYSCEETKSVGCKDKRSDCDYYSQNGYCQDQVDQMTINCAKTCDLCTN